MHVNTFLHKVFRFVHTHLHTAQGRRDYLHELIVHIDAAGRSREDMAVSIGTVIISVVIVTTSIVSHVNRQRDSLHSNQTTL